MKKLDVVRAAACGTVLPSETRYKYVMAARAKPGMTAIVREATRQSICSVCVGKVKFHAMQ